ncbi:hypothetical protein QYF36_001942 [Acer negundo]|nr:hypothetical protein QYF36_001942 [Acer negundo]
MGSSLKDDEVYRVFRKVTLSLDDRCTFALFVEPTLLKKGIISGFLMVASDDPSKKNKRSSRFGMGTHSKASGLSSKIVTSKLGKEEKNRKRSTSNCLVFSSRVGMSTSVIDSLQNEEEKEEAVDSDLVYVDLGKHQGKKRKSGSVPFGGLVLLAPLMINRATSAPSLGNEVDERISLARNDILVRGNSASVDPLANPSEVSFCEPSRAIDVRAAESSSSTRLPISTGIELHKDEGSEQPLNAKLVNVLVSSPNGEDNSKEMSEGHD